MNAIAHASAMPASGPQLDNRRVAAALIDLVIVVAGALVIGVAAGLSGAEDTSLALTGIVTAWALYYYFACESGGGQTLGKKAMKLRVVKMDGSSAGMGDIAVRTVLRVIDGLLLYLVGLIVMLATGKRRGRLGDLAAGTMIVSADGAALPAGPVPAAAPAVAKTFSLPSHGPGNGATVAAPVAPVAGPESLAVPEMRPFEPVGQPIVEPEPAEHVSVVEPDPVVDVDPEPEPVVEVMPAFPLPLAEPEPTVEVLAVPLFGVVEPVDEPVPVSAPDPEPEVDEEPQVVVKSFETVSAIDLIMGEDKPDEDTSDDDSRPASI